MDSDPPRDIQPIKEKFILINLFQKNSRTKIREFFYLNSFFIETSKIFKK